MDLLIFLLVSCSCVCRLNGFTTDDYVKLEPTTDFTGILVTENDGDTYDLTANSSSGLFDSSPSTGVSISNARAVGIYLNLNANWDIRYIYLTYSKSYCTTPTSDTKFSFDNNTEEIDTSEMTISSSGSGSTSRYYVEWDSSPSEVTSGTKTELYTNDLLLYVYWGDLCQSSAIFQTIEIKGVIPTSAPTIIPTLEPTTGAPTPPSPSPTVLPTDIPTLTPTDATNAPSPSPTYAAYLLETPRDDEYASQSIFNWSLNVYPLSYRNLTYATFTVPGGKAFCATCILAWADIDAYIYVDGCDDYDFGITDSDGTVIEPGAFYQCNGTWIIETSGALVSFQQTYGRLEIWEVDDYDRKYLQEYFEFQWNTSNCTWTNEDTGEVEICDVLPLTGSNTDAAMFRWTMPKLRTDNRDRPLIIVWYDLLSVPYSLRPALNDTWWNLTFEEIDNGSDLGLEEVFHRFEAAFWAVGFLLLGFIVVMVVACVFADEAILKQDYMLDTRDIRTTYIHSVTTLIAPQSELQSRSKFSMKRHGVWLFLVLAFRLAYMFIFTFIFFTYVFVTINQTSFNVLDEYDAFAKSRDTQLKNMSVRIEAYYYNETDRMEEEVAKREYYCYDVYINETKAIYTEGALAQYANHSTQMQNSLDSINLNNVSLGLSLTGSTACNIASDDGADILSRDPYPKYLYKTDGSYANTTYYYASDYNRSVLTGPYNFSYIESYFVSVCESTYSCVGWTWIDAYYDNATNTSYPNSYYFLSELGDPTNGELSGLCYAETDLDYDLSSISALYNYTDYLESLYLSNYISSVDEMYDTFTSMWDSLMSVTDGDNGNVYSNIEVIVDSDATDFDTTLELKALNIKYNSSTTNSKYYMSWVIYMDCPGCPTGNWSNVYLQELTDYLFSYNYSNISDFINDAASSSNFSDYVSVDTSWLEYPEIPEIDLPFDIDVPNMGFWELVSSIAWSLDILLFIYRWYRTAGIIATIVRGKDVEIRLKYLQTDVAPPPPCWSGKECADKSLNSVIWCHDKIRHCGYNVWRFMYWIWTMLLMSILVLMILILYIIVDNVITVDFFTGLGAFELLTVGLAAQRSIRNEVICTTALSYNNYTLELLQTSRENYADAKNDDAYDQNVDELERVDEYNSYFCTAYTAYQATARDVTRDCGCSLESRVTTNLSTSLDISLAFDGDDETYWGVSAIDSLSSDTNIYIDIELPAIQMTNTRKCYWDMSEISFDWRFNNNGTFASSLSTAEYEIYAKGNVSDEWEKQDLSSYIYKIPSKSLLNDVEDDSLDWDLIVSYIRIVFFSIETWEDTLFLNEITFSGSAEEDCIGCDTVTFYYWDFNAYDTYVELCPSVTPVHGIMYRGWVRDWLTDQLIEGHTPFIKAIRNIALSPFAILLVGAMVLMLIYLLAFIVEFILLKVNLYRENPFARVPLVHAKNSEFYDPHMHDVDKDKEKSHSNVGTYYGNSGYKVADLGAVGGGGSTEMVSTGGPAEIDVVKDFDNGLGKKLATNRKSGLPQTNDAQVLPSQPIEERNAAAQASAQAYIDTLTQSSTTNMIQNDGLSNNQYVGIGNISTSVGLPNVNDENEYDVQQYGAAYSSYNRPKPPAKPPAKNTHQ